MVALLSRRGSTPSPFVIKPFLSKVEKNNKKLLLQERWRLIQNGTPKQDIRLGKSSIYIKGDLHATVTNSALSVADSSTVNISSFPSNVDNPVDTGSGSNALAPNDPPSPIHNGSATTPAISTSNGGQEPA
uniref:Uncharacterized protein n=1 Tax=Amphimedon queenslandica TaxID=400682 RepID=A0A1X7T642_AMPQE